MNGPKLIGRYEIVAEIGRGAMGSVFKARDPAVGRIVALKTVHASALASEQSEEFRARFYREARASGVLAHPGIVPVFDVGEHEGAPFLVMEFVDGRTLGEAIKKGERFTLDRVCEIGHQMGDALGYAHRQGVIHRDVKPANILMTSREVYGSERPRITDFGIAKLTSVDITTTGQVLGTPSYMAPELLAGSPADGRCDIFSLGVILYALTAGELPFAGETLMAVSYKITHVEAIPPSKLNPAVSPGLEAVILKALAKRPDTRYQTCEELVLDLAAIRAGTSPAALSSIPAAPIDANATLAPGNRTPLPGAAQISAAATPTPASTSAASKPAAGPGREETRQASAGRNDLRRHPAGDRRPWHGRRRRMVRLHACSQLRSSPAPGKHGVRFSTPIAGTARRANSSAHSHSTKPGSNSAARYARHHSGSSAEPRGQSRRDSSKSTSLSCGQARFRQTETGNTKVAGVSATAIRTQRNRRKVRPEPSESVCRCRSRGLPRPAPLP